MMKRCQKLKQQPQEKVAGDPFDTNPVNQRENVLFVILIGLLKVD